MPGPEGGERRGWDGEPLHEGYLRHHESFRLAREFLARGAEADRAFGGDGSAEFTDPASRIAATLLWVEQNVRNLASDALSEHDQRKALEDVRAILDHFPDAR